MDVQSKSQNPLQASNDIRLGESTIDAVCQAIRDAQWDLAVQGLDSFLVEAKMHYSSYTGKWQRKLPRWMLERGVSRIEINNLESDIAMQWASETGVPRDRSTEWRSFRSNLQRVQRRLRDQSIKMERALARVEILRDQWQSLHDYCVDYIAANLGYVVTRFGEDFLEDALRFVLQGHIRSQQEPQAILASITASMRGHLAGPSRRGNLAVFEFDDRWTLEFDPCGSGGRLQRVGAESGRTEGIIREKHDWAWNTAGVCHYCAHCCLGLTLVPIEQRGEPVLAIDPPRLNLETGQLEHPVCQFTIYKTKDAIPVSVFIAVGK